MYLRYRWMWVVLVSSLIACNGGGGWGQVSAASELMFVTDVWAFSETDVWFVGNGSAAHRYDGKNWSTLATPSTQGLGCIFNTTRESCKWQRASNRLSDFIVEY